MFETCNLLHPHYPTAPQQSVKIDEVSGWATRLLRLLIQAWVQAGIHQRCRLEREIVRCRLQLGSTYLGSNPLYAFDPLSRALIERVSGVTVQDLTSSPFNDELHTLHNRSMAAFLAALGETSGGVSDDFGLTSDNFVGRSLEYFLLVRLNDSVEKGMAAWDTVRRLLIFGGKRTGFKNLDFDCTSWKKCSEAFQQKYIFLSFFGLATKWLKFHLAAFFSRAQKQELPPPLWNERPGMFLSGVGYCCLMVMMKARAPQVHYSVLMAKKGFPEVTAEELVVAKKECYKTLSTEHLPRYDGVSGVSPYGHHISSLEYHSMPYNVRLGTLVGTVRRTVRECFRSTKFQESLRIPSSSAHYMARKKAGGGLLALTGMHAYVKGSPVRGDLPYCGTGSSSDHARIFPPPAEVGVEPLHSLADSCMRAGDVTGAGAPSTESITNYRLITWSQMVKRPHIYGIEPECGIWYLPVARNLDDPCYVCCSEESQYWVLPLCPIVEELLSRDPSQHNNEQFETIIGTTVSVHQLACGMKSAVYDLALEDLSRPELLRSTCNIVEPVTLPEPLKVRVITKGNRFRYWLAQDYQTSMHSVLRRLRPFRAIGRPLRVEDLDSLGTLDGAEEWMSGDYKSATDLLHPDLSLAAVREISRIWKLNPLREMLFEEGLTGALLGDGTVDNRLVHLQGLYESGSLSLSEYRDECDLVLGEHPRQVWGQLMGSPYSFPILCVVNLAVCRFVSEMSLQREVSVHDFPGLVNGDDVLMKLDPLEYDTWKQVVKDSGLIPSLGKNYLSREFAIINSTLYVDRGPSLWGLQNFEELPYLNLDLLGNRVRESTNSRTWNLENLGANGHALLKGFVDPEDRDWIMTQFMESKTVKRLAQTVAPGVSLFVSKALGGIGLPVTRSGLLSPSQQGYYTRVAGTKANPALALDDVVLNGIDPRCPRVPTLYEQVPRHEVFSDWVHLGLEYEFAQCPSSQLWKALNALSGGFWDAMQLGFLSEAKRPVLFRSPCKSSYFRAHDVPYSDRLLANYPFRVQTLYTYDNDEAEIKFNSKSILDQFCEKCV